jgi:predicted nucleotidyltransferase
VDPLEERIRARQQCENALGQARLAKLPGAVALLRRLGVERVWLFGSLVTGATHAGSDVDLMVRGLPVGERTKAWLELEEIFGASVDLVPEEASSSAFRDAVTAEVETSRVWESSMSPSEVASAVRWRLASDIETELASQTKVAERIATLRARLGSEPDDWILAAAMAFEIERWYTAVESLFVRILRTLEGDVPTGPAHHWEVMRVASLAVEPLRPALIPAAAEGDLRELLGFRHFARHAYDVEPEPARMLEHADRVARLQLALTASMAQLVGRLRAAVV